MAMFSDDFEDGDLSEWTTSTTSNADVQLDGGRMRLRVYKCNTAIAERDLGTLDGTLTVSFDWENLAEQWYEGTDWQLLDGDGGAIEYELVEGTDVRSPGHRGNRSGTVTAEATVDGPVTLQFVVRPSSHCSNFDHANTYLWIDNVEVDASNVAVPTGLVWDVPIDWDSTVDSSGVVHEAVANTDHVDSTVLKQGYSVERPRHDADIVGYWPCHEDGGTTTYDFSGNDLNGSGNPGKGATGILGNSSYAFDGSQSVTIDEDPILDLTDAISLLLWFKTGSPGQGDRRIVDKTQGGAASAYGIDLYKGFRFISEAFTIYRKEELPADEWLHLAITWSEDHGYGRFYLNGEEDKVVEDQGRLIATNDLPLLFGDSPTHHRPLYDSNIAEVHLYDRRLTAAEVQDHYDVVATPGTITTASKEAQQ